MQQFLLNPDGTIPQGTDVAALEAAGVLFVVPTPLNTPSPGMELHEGHPSQDVEGVWRQVWLERPIISPHATPPEVVSMRQARLALLQSGLLDDVEAAIITMAEPQRTSAQIEWEYSTEVNRASPTTAMLAGVLGLTEEQIDQLFSTAAAL